MNNTLIILITTITNFLTLLIIADALLSFILPPYHTIRETLGRILQPLYAPLRRIIPPLGMIDITPIVLLLLLRFISNMIISALR
jgi:YggT family protein